MPPRGQRRPGGRGNSWTSAASLEAWQRDVEDHFIVLPQIETQVGLDNVKEIAEHEITTSLAHGPYDLSFDLGVGGQMAGPEGMAATRQMQAAANAAGKKMWVIGDGPTLRAEGYTFLCVGVPTAVLFYALQEIVETTQK